MHVFLLKCGLRLHVKSIALVIISYDWKDDAERKLTNPCLLSLSFYTPVIRQDVLWFGNICGHICQSYVNTLFMEKLFIYLFSGNHAWVYVLLFVHLIIFLDVYIYIYISSFFGRKCEWSRVWCFLSGHIGVRDIIREMIKKGWRWYSFVFGDGMLQSELI